MECCVSSYDESEQPYLWAVHLDVSLLMGAQVCPLQPLHNYNWYQTARVSFAVWLCRPAGVLQ